MDFVQRVGLHFRCAILLVICCKLSCGFDLKTVYCKVTDNCACDFKPNIKGLEWDLFKNVHGQHLAQTIIPEALSKFLKNDNPDRPLVLSLHGASGTGKSFVTSMVVRYLYGTEMGSPYVHLFVPMIHFPVPERLQQYKVNLKHWIEGNLTACAQSIFIFDEIERMPAGLIDVLEPFLGPSHIVYRTNYRKAIYILISTIGQEAIHKVTLDSRKAGKDREEIDLQELVASVKEKALSTSNNGFYNSRIISKELVSNYVPFLPLRIHHVRQCAQRELCQRGECERADVADLVSRDICGSASEGTLEHQFSSTGCKQVASKVNVYL